MARYTVIAHKNMTDTSHNDSRFSERMEILERLLLEESDPKGASFRRALWGDFHYPEQICPLERLLLELRRRPTPCTAKYAEIAAEALTRHPVVSNVITRGAEKPKPGEPLEAYRKRRCDDAETRIRERKIQGYEAELKEVIEVRDSPNVTRLLHSLADLSSPWLC